MIAFLPIEILQRIFQYVREERFWHPGDLARCCRSSKTFLAVAQPILFRNIEIRVGIAEDYHDYGEKQFHFKWEGQQLVQTLRSHPHLREMVKQVSFEGIDYASWDDNYDEDPSDIFDPLVELLDNRTVIALSGLSQHYDIDRAIFSAQTRFAGKAAPLFRRVFNVRPNDHEENQFESAYEGYQTDRYPWYPEYEKLLHGSFDTLTRLDIQASHPSLLSHDSIGSNA